MKILCRTLFDCGRTGTTGHMKLSQLPFEDSLGQTITDAQTWNRSRNQQRNFETIMQMISLRAQPTMTQDPVEHNGEWQFEFEVETPGVYSRTGNVNDTSVLLQECQGTPMIQGLRESKTTANCLHTTGTEQNIWFETINI